MSSWLCSLLSGQDFHNQKPCSIVTLTMDSKVCRSGNSSNGISSRAGVHSSVLIGHIHYCQLSEPTFITITYNGVLNVADNVHHCLVEISKRPRDSMIRRCQSITREHSTGSIVNYELIHWRINYHWWSYNYMRANRKRKHKFICECRYIIIIQTYHSQQYQCMSCHSQLH